MVVQASSMDVQNGTGHSSFLESSQDSEIFGPLIRWCRCARPPANDCIPSGKEKFFRPDLPKEIVTRVVCH